MTPGTFRFAMRALSNLLAVCLLYFPALVGCRQVAGVNVNFAVPQGPTLSADLLPVSVSKNNLHTAGAYWLAAGDLAEIINPQQYTFGLTDPANPNTAFLCTSTPTSADCGNNVPVGIAFAVDVVECPGQAADCSGSEKVFQNFPIPISDTGLRQLSHQQFAVDSENATYSLRPTATWQKVYQGALVSPMKVIAVPSGMSGLTFSAPLTYTGGLPSGEKWQWSEKDLGWGENFGSSLQVTTISVSQEGSPTKFCGVSFQNRNCGCNGDEMLMSACETVDLRQCGSLNGLVITPTYILNNIADQLANADDSLQWRARFAAQNCGLTVPDSTQHLTINFTVVARQP